MARSRRFTVIAVVAIIVVACTLLQSQRQRQRPPKEIIVASLRDDDTTWLAKRLPEWPVTRYIVDDPAAEFTVPANKGREATVYLTYLIDHYDLLPDIMVFIHSLQYQWHNDDSNKDGATVLSRLQLPYVQQEGYVALRCAWSLGCPSEIKVHEQKYDFPDDYTFADGFADVFPTRAANTPDVVAAGCCSQFALSRDKAREIPREEYQRLRQWLLDTPQDDSVSGRIMEYSWHMLYGKPDVHCPDAQECYCNVFGLCNLTCTEGGCEGQYTLPQYSTMPDDWQPLDKPLDN